VDSQLLSSILGFRIEAAMSWFARSDQCMRRCPLSWRPAEVPRTSAKFSRAQSISPSWPNLIGPKISMMLSACSIFPFKQRLAADLSNRSRPPPKLADIARPASRRQMLAVPILKYKEWLFRAVVRAAITECYTRPYFMRPAAVSALVMTAPTSIPRYRA
jgi:hypothetical protein